MFQRTGERGGEEMEGAKSLILCFSLVDSIPRGKVKVLNISSLSGGLLPKMKVKVVNFSSLYGGH